ncbi:carbon-nitrogen hydrolase family protein [Oceanobacter mangrovi]|uniref:carbon-nitrogen hydrolase family protein n=1 Tax=Oceanobacter mangrovi TaxID=2862510 RepID=UPI001C8D345F|nr:carbon-nitrogen hydrolase family protein [Oceanobacter mangrovi]
MSKIRVASAAYEVGYLDSRQAWLDKIRSWVEQAAQQGAQVLVFPEYFSMELASLFAAEVYQSLTEQLVQLQNLHEGFVAHFSNLAREFGVLICAGTFPVLLDEGLESERYVNRCYLLMPDGAIDWQDKLQMTRFENEQWGIASGDALRVFETQFGKIAVNICYDSEFPLFARQQVIQGADLILVPSCTDTLAGFHRVQIGCRARALENQCFVVQSPTVGNAEWSPAIDENNGAAGVFAPVAYGFPADGIVAQTPLNEPGWCYADLDLAELARVRSEGQVFNYRDWDGQQRFV